MSHHLLDVNVIDLWKCKPLNTTHARHTIRRGGCLWYKNIPSLS